MKDSPILDTEDVLQHALARKLEQLPVLPAVVTKLLSLDHSGEDYFELVREAVEEDPPLAARIVMCANSARFAPPTPVTSLRAALPWLGSQTVRHLILSCAVARVFRPTTPGQRRLWVHSVQVGAIARLIVERAQYTRVDPDTVYLAGLLHDIGKFLMFRELPAEEAATAEWRHPSEATTLERRDSGFDHAELGWRACIAWRLPAEIATLVRDHHHDVVADEHVAPEHRAAVLLLQTADAVSRLLQSDAGFSQAGANDRAARLSASCFDPRLRSPVLDPLVLAGVCDEILQDTAHLADLLEVQAD